MFSINEYILLKFINKIHRLLIQFIILLKLINGINKTVKLMKLIIHYDI